MGERWSGPDSLGDQSHCSFLGLGLPHPTQEKTIRLVKLHATQPWLNTCIVNLEAFSEGWPME